MRDTINKFNEMPPAQKALWAEKWLPIREANLAIGNALWELNESRAVNGRAQSLAGKPFNLIHEAWTEMVRLQFGYESWFNSANMEVNWGATGGETFAQDLKAAILAEFLRAQNVNE